MRPELFDYDDSFERRTRRDRIFFNNPVIMQGLGLAPIIVAATTLKNAVMLSVAVIPLLVLTRVIAAVLARATYFRFRGLTYSVTSAVVYIGVYFLMTKLFTAADLALLGLYLPLLVVDPIVLKRYERPQKERVSTAFSKGVITALGFALTIRIVGGLREILGAGALYGVQLVKTPPFPMAAMPAGAFVLLAVLMAAWRGVVNTIKRQVELEKGVRTGE